MKDNSQLNSPLLVKRAKELAGAAYEEGFTALGERWSARFRAMWPTAERFVARNWPSYLDAAYTYHATLLGAPDGLIPQAEKDALQADMWAYFQRTMLQKPSKVGYGPLMLRPDRPGTLEQKIFGKH